MSVATQSSLIPVPSRILCRRLGRAGAPGGGAVAVAHRQARERRRSPAPCGHPTCRTLDHSLHLGSLHSTIRSSPQGVLRTYESDGRALGNSPRCRQDPRAKLDTGSQAARRPGVSRRRRKDRCFQPPVMPIHRRHAERDRCRSQVGWSIWAATNAPCASAGGDRVRAWPHDAS